MLKDKIEENILKQIDKTFVLCIDPETRLPFMVNMGLKTADICDLDDRALSHKGANVPRGQSSGLDSDVNSAGEEEMGPDEGYHSHYDILKCTNYPFYHKITRSLYIMGQLLNDENNKD